MPPSLSLSWLAGTHSFLLIYVRTRIRSLGRMDGERAEENGPRKKRAAARFTGLLASWLAAQLGSGSTGWPGWKKREEEFKMRTREFMICYD